MNLNLQDKVYALELDLNQLYENKRIRSKVGYTTKDIDRRISGFRMSGNLKGQEHLIKKVLYPKIYLQKALKG